MSSLGPATATGSVLVGSSFALMVLASVELASAGSSPGLLLASPLCGSVLLVCLGPEGRLDDLVLVLEGVAEAVAPDDSGVDVTLPVRVFLAATGAGSVSEDTGDEAGDVAVGMASGGTELSAAALLAKLPTTRNIGRMSPPTARARLFVGQGRRRLLRGARL